MEGTSGLALSVINPAATTGGEDRNVPSPTEQDLRRVTDRLLLSLQESARQDVERMLGDTGIVMADTLQVRETIFTQQQPDLGEPGDVLTLTMQVEFEARYIERKDLERVATMAMDAGLQAGYEPVPETLRILEVHQTNSGAEISDWQVVAARAVQENWQRDAAIRSLLGARPDEVAAILGADYQMDAAPVVKIQPSWWPWLPYLPLRIQLEVQ